MSRETPRTIRQLVVREADLRARWFRLKIDFDNPQTAPHKDFPEERSGIYEFPSLRDVPALGGSQTYPPVGVCIYCGASLYRPNSDQRLSDEHVVPEGLGGNLILPESSCESCAKITTTIEGSVLRSVLWVPRKHLNIRGKKRRRNADESFGLTTFVGGKEVQLNLPLDAHPSILLLLRLLPPGIVEGRPEMSSGATGFWIHEVRSEVDRYMRQKGMPHFATPAIDSVRFCQLLGKIAHAYAAAEVGLGNFEAMLPRQLVLRQIGPQENWCGCYQLVGGDSGRLFDPAPALHQIGWGLYDHFDKVYLVVSIRLFARLGAPAYHVIAGTVSRAQSENLLAQSETA